MKITHAARVAILFAVASISRNSIARAGDPSVAELQDQLRQLQAKVEQLESNQQQRQHQADSRAVDETVERVLRDSEKRSQLLQNDTSLTAGWSDGHFFLASTDGNYLLVPHFHFQFRNDTTWNTAGDDDIENGFEVRRMKFIFDGNAICKDLTYHFQWNTTNGTGSVFLEDAWAKYTFDHDHGLSVRAGQHKDIWSKEWTNPDWAVLAVERSLMDALIGGQLTNRVQGVTLIQETDRYVAALLYHDGANSINTNFQDDTGGTAFTGGQSNFGVSGRLDYFFSDKSKESEDFSAMDNKQDLFVVGGGFDWTQGGSNNSFFHTIDAQWENTTGLAIYGAAVGVSRDINSANVTGSAPVGNYYDWGLLIQAAYALDEHWEVFGRYDFTKLDDDALAAGAEDTIHELTVGVNNYFHQHNAKLTIDASWLPNGSPRTLDGQDFLASDDNEFVLRAQFQLYL